MATCPTVRIVSNNPAHTDGFVEINATDYNPDTMELFDGDELPADGSKVEHAEKLVIAANAAVEALSAVDREELNKRMHDYFSHRREAEANEEFRAAGGQPSLKVEDKPEDVRTVKELKATLAARGVTHSPALRRDDLADLVDALPPLEPVAPPVGSAPAGDAATGSGEAPAPEIAPAAPAGWPATTVAPAAPAAGEPAEQV